MVLYSENRFIFRGLGFHSEVYSNAAIIPFLEDRSEGSRRLIKQIEYSYSYYFLIRTLIRSDAFLMKLDHSFEETCNYLSQNLQLEHVTLKFYDTLLLGYNVSKDCQLAVDKQNWVQQLIPLVKNLDTFTLISEYGSLNEMLRAAQTYLELKMHKGKQGRAPDSGGTTAGTSSSSF